MSRGKKDKEASIKWWNKLIIESRIEYHYKHYPDSLHKLSDAEVEIVWRRETQKKK